uniref:C-type lectin domain-containing protein n=1 Tax=Magallana gigas TaxID=29159 RepID=A0A8W8L9C2_MAGGI|nr:uncharacterized protein LOC105339115 [Crassostrea gigas]
MTIPRLIIYICVWTLFYFQGFNANPRKAKIHQWASVITGFSSQWTSKRYSANQILGKPNVYPKYVDSDRSWTHAGGQNHILQYLEMKFPRKIYVTSVNIYETLNAGAVVRISAKSPNDQWVEIFWTTQALHIKRARKFSPRIKRVKFPFNELRIEIDCSVSNSYVEIDAVEIVGDANRQCFGNISLHYGNSCYMIKNDKVSGDVAFARCLRFGGHLATFETLEEAMLMKDTLTTMRTGVSYFVGGRNINRRKPGGDWRWIKQGTMTNMTYFAFGSGEPNGTEQSPQDCLMFYAGDGYKFHDAKCSGMIGGYICEF